MIYNPTPIQIPIIFNFFAIFALFLASEIMPVRYCSLACTLKIIAGTPKQSVQKIKLNIEIYK